MQTKIISIFAILHIHLLTLGGVFGILNRQSGSCNHDDDCSSRETFLYCINRKCLCLQGGSTYVHGVLLQFNMEWDPFQTKCVSQPGSPCTLKNRWYSSSDTTKLDCSQGSTCILHSSSLGDSNTRQYQYQQQQSRFQQDYTITQNDFGICWKNRQEQGFGGGGDGSGVGSVGSQTPFYPILTPNKQYQPNRHEFSSHGNGYPISPTKLDNSATCGKCNKGGFIFGLIMLTVNVLVCRT